jgi:hypothetical protein
MAGKIKHLIDKLIEERAHGNPTLASITRTKLVLKGIVPDKYTSSSEDDQGIIAKINQTALEMNIKL